MARKPTILQNTRIEDIREDWYGREHKGVWPLWLDDIVSGICRLDWYGEREQQVPLSTAKLIRILTELEEISSENVSQLLKTGVRMARKYAQAARIAYPLIVKSLDTPSIRSMRYPHRSLASYDHGVALGYDRASSCGSARDVE